MRRNMPYSGATVVIVGLLLFAVNMVCAEGQAPEVGHEISSVQDTVEMGDSIIVIHTVCAPICSSCARVYNKEWQFLGNMTPPIKTAFPEAYIEEGKIVWRDNDPNDYTPAP